MCVRMCALFMCIYVCVYICIYIYNIYALVYHYICVLENITSLLASDAPVLPPAMVRTDRVSEHLPISKLPQEKHQNTVLNSLSQKLLMLIINEGAQLLF